MVAASAALVDHLVSDLGVPNNNVVLMGQSIGCVPALALAARGYGTRSVFVSPFTSVRAMALSAYPILYPAQWLLDWMILDRCDNLVTAQAVRTPSLVLHGTADEIVPYAQGVTIHETLGDAAEFRSVEGAGHNDILTPTTIKQIVDFAES